MNNNATVTTRPDGVKLGGSFRALLSFWQGRNVFTALAAVAMISLWQALRSQLFGQRKSHDHPGLLARHTSIGPLTTRHFTYPAVRLVYCPHSKAAKLPADLPLLVFVHGLGGSAAQFAPLATSLSSAASCLLIDFPGCGRSDLGPQDSAAYTLQSLAEVVLAAIDRYRLEDQKVVLVAHSLGCSVSIVLTSTESSLGKDVAQRNLVAGLVLICPRADPLPPKLRKACQRSRFIPIWLFDLWRAWDKRGGLQAASITRGVGTGADTETRKLQQRYNAQSRSATVLKFLTALGRDDCSWPDERAWQGVELPMFLVAAEADSAVDPKSIERVVEWIMTGHKDKDSSSPQDLQPSHIPAAAGDVDQDLDRLTNTNRDGSSKPRLLPHDHESMKTVSVEHETVHHAHAIKTTLFPAPAAHGVMYATDTVRPLASLIQNFLASHVDSRMSPAWQLKHMSTSGKWDVKNLKKWDKVDPISDIIADQFRAMKTMREVDGQHSPTKFVGKYGCFDEEGRFRTDGVGIVVDISHETPVYDPKGLETHGVHYYKFPTVSKLPPSSDEVAAFISLINRLREEDENVKKGAKIGVHCHYGFNRTGFFLICYLIEQLGWTVQDAIREFKTRRPPGVKHDYFVDELYLRYAVSLQRRGTIMG